ncbi:MAG: 30S ribosomal protein S20 [Holosporaceae bacterium]|jgi:small subunit ribosomal protein S20|nr:30S ribosomal protein S20 [Holosporaceae bacterium]
MANHKSALKRIRRNRKSESLNKGRISRIRTFIKKFISSLGMENVSTDFSRAQSEIQKGVTKGVLHKNTAARKISRLNKTLKSTLAK